MKRRIALLLSFLLLLPNISYTAQSFDNRDVGAAVLADYETGDILYSYNTDISLEVASLTKIMTYLVTMDQISKGNANLKDKITISENAAQRGGSSFKLKPGEEYTLDQLLESIMIVSANDSCIAIAEHISGSEKSFTKLMNQKAQEIGLEKTYFASVNGYPDGDIHNTMNTSDILKLTRYTIQQYPQILDITKKDEIIDDRGYEFKNTNPLMGVIEGTNGLKTGYTDIAKYCLVSTVDINRENNQDQMLIGIIMGAPSENIRTAKSIELINMGMDNSYKKEKILDKNISVGEGNIIDGIKENVQLYPVEDMYGIVKEGQAISKKINMFDHISAPVKKGDVVGEIIIEYGDNIKKMDLVVNENIKKSNFINMFFKSVKGFISFIF
ncbi:serine-type D-alanyl-D-alanine carboxypeptidase DacF [Gottschalkia acidurici 9a]|uniref:serine-type D-Ala-D-Ala carboxypeptidase n=1 Tax=Gottschalkia acidurici (strain ATCC 7906 / DSM 604 / BCRC 14475 / CIP 104303 / KCTC 5404 / NCIMB 10678 / 9a) TaxID=1128398 RepID=K0AWI0_GOTA9|nr:D-alanyl-D-alanine carboxypeptidase family protein [Gottschalkia acidurici]AFS77117.1 serine-type D-alanyl-D-alanine carboxypeptidase DacF [Gottschalkia acidurici 9a]